MKLLTSLFVFSCIASVIFAKLGPIENFTGDRVLQVISDYQLAFPLKSSNPDIAQTNIQAWIFFTQPGENRIHLQLNSSKKYIVYNVQGLRLVASQPSIPSARDGIFFKAIPTSRTGYFQLRTNYVAPNGNSFCLNCSSLGALSVAPQYTNLNLLRLHCNLPKYSSMDLEKTAVVLLEDIHNVLAKDIITSTQGSKTCCLRINCTTLTA